MEFKGLFSFQGRAGVHRRAAWFLFMALLALRVVRSKGTLLIRGFLEARKHMDRIVLQAPGCWNSRAPNMTYPPPPPPHLPKEDGKGHVMCLSTSGEQNVSVKQSRSSRKQSRRARVCPSARRKHYSPAEAFVAAIRASVPSHIVESTACRGGSNRRSLE